MDAQDISLGVSLIPSQNVSEELRGDTGSPEPGT